MNKPKNLYIKFLVIAVLVASLVLLIDAAVMSILFNMGGFMDALFHFDLQEAWMRFLIIAGIFTFCIYAAKATTNIQRSRDEAVLTKELLQSVLNTIPVRVFWKAKDLSYFGCNSYIRKPVDFHQFVEAVKQVELYWLVMNVPPPTHEKAG